MQVERDERGLFTKGNRGGPGRVKGSVNVVSKTTREVIGRITGGYFNSAKFLRDLEKLEPKDRLLIMEKLVNYIVPKMQATTIEANVEQKQSIAARLIELSRLNEVPPTDVKSEEAD